MTGVTNEGDMTTRISGNTNAVKQFARRRSLCSTSIKVSLVVESRIERLPDHEEHANATSSEVHRNTLRQVLGRGRMGRFKPAILVDEVGDLDAGNASPSNPRSPTQLLVKVWHSTDTQAQQCPPMSEGCDANTALATQYDGLSSDQVYGGITVQRLSAHRKDRLAICRLFEP
ncbi:hypothetical protein BDY19DRAFT_902899 [Irpex rosettiformis]|uniref:Uncharacterized protein n=1 Tax=Irpex rosettiformis TaxID=378272 RepID=A0ACB8UFR4_9APHY|nr:hypothetical protein BDY19DRAFT_902899 [Irpex rosettiformis]